MQIIKSWISSIKKLFQKKREEIVLEDSALKEQSIQKNVPSQPTTMVPKWMQIASAELGVKEKPGAADNPRVIEYHSLTTLKATEDSVPWCSSFVSWCLEKSGVQSTKSAWARSYLNWGVELKEPKYGCIVVFTRGASSGHVAFFVDKSSHGVKVLGGNQSDEVNYSYYSQSRVLGYRWPKA